MPVVIFLFFLPLIFAAVIFGFGAFVGYVVIPVLKFALGVAAIGAAGYGVYLLYDRERKSSAERKERQEDHAETMRLYRLATRKYPTTEDFLEVLTEHLTEELRLANLAPPREVLAQMMLAASEMYDADIPDCPPAIPTAPLEAEDEFLLQGDLLPAAEYAERFDPQVMGQAMVSCFMAFARKLPPVREAQFGAPAGQFMPVAQVVTDMAMSFYADDLKNRQLLEGVRNQYHRGGVYAMMQQIKRPKEGELVWPREYKGADIPGVYLPPNLAALFKVAVPFGLSDETRFMHHHVLGDTGTGKTTFLSHLIRYDLDKVAKGECSVVIIDSTRRMVRSLASSKWFAPGGPLHGRLILVGPEDPIALNLFADKKNVDASVDIISHALSGIFEAGADASIFQAGASRYIIRAIIEHGGNLLDFSKLLQPKGQYVYAEAIARCPQNVQDYFQHTFAGLRDQSRQSLAEKLAFVREKPVLERMFTAPDCRLDLLAELQQGGKVVLIDTDKDELTSEGSSLLGRFFLAMLNRVVQARSRFDEFSLKPVWVYLDEAQNYIENDDRFAELLTDARQRRVGLTVAHHDWRQINSQKVRLGLEGAAIHTNTLARGKASVSFRNGPSYEIPYTNFQFRELDPMSSGDWARVRAENQTKYGAVAPKVPDIRIDQDATTQF